MMNRKKLILMIGVGLFLLSSCSDSIMPGDENIADSTGKDVATATFHINLETQEMSTRLNNDGNGEVSHIGKGEKIDRLIYAVYMVDEATGKYTTEAAGHPAQVIIPADFSDNKTVEFTLEGLMPDKTYHVAFWAQNSQSKAYDTSNLACVEVKYKDANGNNFTNNDESRDAFCNVWTGSFSADPEKEQEEIFVTLYRPLSQINVGTTGADYKNVLQGPDVYPNLKITHSKISVKGVARFFNVVESRILLQDDMAAIGRNREEAFTDASFDWGVLPAFMNMANVPSTVEGLLQSDDEEYLRVDLNQDDEISGFLTSFPTLSADGDKYLTETFKYLSMCYVLSPSGDSGKSTFENIRVGFAESAEGSNGNTPVSVMLANGGRNYRTNILGGFGWVKDPGDNTPDDPNNPGGPDDPNNPGGPDDPNNPGGPDDPNNPGGPDDPNNPGQPELPDNPVPSLFTRNFSILIHTEFQGSVTVDKEKETTITWVTNSQN